MRMTVLRGAIYADHFAQRDEFCRHMEQGIHEFDYCLFPYEGKTAAEQKASELNFGLRRVLGCFHKGSLPEKMGCIENIWQNVIISAIKPQADGNGIVLRGYEIEGQQTTAQIKLFGDEVTMQIPAYGVKTIDNRSVELDAMEWEVK